MVARSDRVKGVELHPTEPWLLANLYNGNVYIWNYNDSVRVSFVLCCVVLVSGRNGPPPRRSCICRVCAPELQTARPPGTHP